MNAAYVSSRSIFIVWKRSFLYDKKGRSEDSDRPDWSVWMICYSADAQALSTEPNSSIFSFTVALIASKPGASSLRGS